MSSEKPSIEILRGFGAFTRVITKGKRFEKQPIKAFVFSSVSKKTALHVGYTVTKKIRIVAHRNRIKRLMREAFLVKKKDFIKKIDSGMLIEIVFMYNGNTEIAPAMVRFSSIEQAFSDLCSIVLQNDRLVNE